MATTYIQFTGRLKATSQEGILAEAQQVAVSSTDSTNIKTYIDNKIKEVQGSIGSVAGSVYRPKGSLTVANFKALTSAAVGDVYNITEQFTLSGRTYPAYTNVACVKAFSSAVTPDDSYWDALGGTVDLSPYAKTADVNTKVDTINKSISDNVSSLTTKISTAQSTANTANDTANANKTSISGLTTRVSTLEGSDHVNKINTVKVNGTALTPDGNKAVNIPLATTSSAGLMSFDDKHNTDWLAKYIMQSDTDHPFLNGTMDDRSYRIGWMIDGFTYKYVDIPLTDEEQRGLFDELSYTDYIQPLLKGEYDDRIDANETAAAKAQSTADGKVDKVTGKGLSTNDFTAAYKSKLDGIATGANAYTLPAATASALGGVKVGQVYASGTILPTVATVNLRASDNMAVVPAATTSAAGVMTASDKSKLNAIAGGAQVNVIEKVKVNGADLTPDSEKRVNLGTLITNETLNGRIADSSRVFGNVAIGHYEGKVDICDNVRIGTGVSIGYDSSAKCLTFGTKGYSGDADILLAKNSDLVSLGSRVNRLELLLKLA